MYTTFVPSSGLTVVRRAVPPEATARARPLPLRSPAPREIHDASELTFAVGHRALPCLMILLEKLLYAISMKACWATQSDSCSRECRAPWRRVNSFYALGEERGASVRCPSSQKVGAAHEIPRIVGRMTLKMAS